MIKVGITGGIGTGKTTCCKIFETLGVPVYYADKRAKELMIVDQEMKTQIKALFGPESYFKNGRINRRIIANRVFNNKESLQKLNAIVHPAVQKDTEIWYSQVSNHAYALKEAALFVETGGHKLVDKLIVVASPLELRKERVMLRDRITEEDFENRVKNQLPEEEKLALADFIIYNDMEHSLIQQIQNIHNLLSNSKNSEYDRREYQELASAHGSRR